jgi:hypothetical protein
MMSGSQSPVASKIPLVLPTNAKQPFAKLVVRGEQGQIVQQWLVLQNKCTLGSASACALRCQLPGISAYHALLVVGAKQVFIRALSPKLTRNGVNVNELLLSDGENAFEIAGHRFELLRNFGPTESPQKTDNPSKNERLKFALARPFELNNRRYEEPTKSAPIVESPSAYDPSQMPKWITELIQSAVQPLEKHIQSIVEPLAIAKSEIEKHHNTERRPQAKSKRRRVNQSGTIDSTNAYVPKLVPVVEPIIVAPPVPAPAPAPAPAPTAKVENPTTISPAIEAILEKQNASMDKLADRLNRVTDQLGTLERTVSDNLARQSKPIVEATSPAYDETLHRITAVTEQLGGMIQDLQSRQLALESSDQTWRNTLCKQIDQLQDKISATEKSFQDSARNSVDQAAAALEMKSAEFQAAVMLANDQAIAKFREEIREEFRGETAALVTAQQTALQQAEAKLHKSAEASFAQISRQIAAQAIPMPVMPTPSENVHFDAPDPVQNAVNQPIARHPIVQPVATQLNLAGTPSLPVFEGFEPAPPSAPSPVTWVQEEEIAQPTTFQDAINYQESAYEGNPIAWDASPVTDQNTYAIESRHPSFENESPIAEQNSWPTPMTQESISEYPSPASSSTSEGSFSPLPSWWTDDDKSQFEDDRTLSMSRASEPAENNCYVQSEFPSNAYQDAGSDRMSGLEVENDNLAMVPSIDPSEAPWPQLESSRRPQRTFETQDESQFAPPIAHGDDAILVRSSGSERQEAVNDLVVPKNTPLDSVESREGTTLRERIGETHGQIAPLNTYVVEVEQVASVVDSLELIDEQSEVSEVAALATNIESNYRQKKSERDTLNALRNDLSSPDEDLDAVKPAEEDKPAAAASIDAGTQNGEEDEESIEEYMKRLMARMRGDSEPVEEKKSEPKSQPAMKQSTPRDPSEIKTPVRKTEPAFQSRTTARGPATTAAFNPNEYIPKALAPEKSRNMAAMRELANTSARSAIQVSARRKYGTAVALKLAIAATGFGVGCALIMLNGFKLNIGLIATVASFMVALIWGIDAAGTIKPLLNQDAATPVGDGNAKAAEDAEDDV